MATKINEISKLVPRNSLLFSSWLSAQGIDRKAQTLYVRSGWLERIASGVYKFAGAEPTAYSAVASYVSLTFLPNLLKKSIFIPPIIYRISHYIM